MEAFLWTFHIGLYQLMTIPYHLPFVLLGFLIRRKMKSRRAQWIWLGLLVLMAVGCEFSWTQIGGFDRIGVCLAWAFVIDLAIGTAIIGIPNTIRRFINWIKTEEE